MRQIEDKTCIRFKEKSSEKPPAGKPYWYYHGHEDFAFPKDTIWRSRSWATPPASRGENQGSVLQCMQSHPLCRRYVWSAADCATCSICRSEAVLGRGQRRAATRDDAHVRGDAHTDEGRQGQVHHGLQEQYHSLLQKWIWCQCNFIANQKYPEYLSDLLWVQWPRCSLWLQLHHALWGRDILHGEVDHAT